MVSRGTRGLYGLLFLCAFRASALEIQNLKILMDKAARSGFSGIVIVSQGEQTLWQQSYGWADRRRRIAMNERTEFDVGSVTKQFVATALLKLQEEGKLSLDDTLEKFFRVPKKRRGVTLRSVLRHVSGFEETDSQKIGDELDRLANRPQKYFEALLRLLPFRRPARFYYNNSMYNLLSFVIEKASGQKYETYLSQHLFSVANLRNTGFNTAGSFNTNEAAIGYDGRKEELPAGRLPNGIGYSGCTGVITSGDDLRTWLLAVHRNTVLGPGETEQLFQSSVFAGYSLGWEIREDKQGHLTDYSHSGATIGFLSEVAFYPESETTLILLSNDSSEGWVLGLAKDVLDGRVAIAKLDEAIRQAKQRRGHRPPTDGPPPVP